MYKSNKSEFVKKPVIYIAGKVTGEDIKACKEKFSKAEFILRRKGYHTINPLRLCPPDSNWESAMKMCIRNLIECDAIYMLNDWEESRGAKVEHYIATQLGLQEIREEKIYVA